MHTELHEALAKLDPSNDDHWTKEGSPRIDFLHEVTGDKSIGRQAITRANPELSREWLRAQQVPGRPNPDGGAPTPTPLGGSTPAGNTPASTTDPLAHTPEQKEETPEPDGSEDEERDDVLDMTPAEVYADRGLCERAAKQLEKDETELMEYIEASNGELLQIRHNQTLLARALQYHERINPTPKENPVKAYLASQNNARLKRAKAAQAFLKGGTTANDVRAALGGRSPLDTAIASKKTVQIPLHRQGQE